MANEEVVSSILKELPDEAPEFGIDSDYIGIMLDSGVTRTKTTLAAWRVVAAKTSTVADVSESGSTRNLGAIFNNAMQVIATLQARADLEDKAVADAVAVLAGRPTLNTIIRI